MGHQCKEHPIAVLVRLAVLFELLAVAFLVSATAHLFASSALLFAFRALLFAFIAFFFKAALLNELPLFALNACFL